MSDRFLEQTPGGSLVEIIRRRIRSTPSEPSPMAADSPNRIGNLNRPWSVMLRLALASYPLVLAWSVWVTSNVFADIAFRNSGDRFTTADGAKLRADMVERINDNTKPIQIIDARLVRVETKLDTLIERQH